MIPSFLYFLSVPDVSRLKRENPKKTALMEYREIEWREKKKKFKIHQTWVPLSKISPYLIKSVLIAEDDKFWRHEGFDYEAIQKPLRKTSRQENLSSEKHHQPATCKKSLSFTGQNPLRKMREAMITWRIEKTLRKKRILELYLNLVEWVKEYLA